MDKIPKWYYWYAIVAILGVSLLHDVWVQWRQVEPLPYSEFLKQLKAGNVADIAVRTHLIEGSLKRGLPDGRTRFATTRVEGDLARDLAQYDVRFEGVIESTFVRDLLGWIIPALLFFAVWSWAARRMAGKDSPFGGGLLSIGKSKAKVYVETDIHTGFDDVAGVDEAKDELREVVEFLRNPAET